MWGNFRTENVVRRNFRGKISAAKFPAVKFSCGEIYFLEVHRENIYSMKLMLRNFRGEISDGEIICDEISSGEIQCGNFRTENVLRRNFRGEISDGEMQCGEICPLKMLCGEISSRRNIPPWNIKMRHVPLSTLRTLKYATYPQIHYVPSSTLGTQYVAYPRTRYAF